ncbi:arylesterase [Ollibium composti]|uniref:Arylesterase n=1 Tax=Ollibium composti TaxID=2675109 RepID=A0ABY2Q6G4_9HYPH|nr:arylesterase [Mesorhizobium composti]THF57121.1 arylesterase [Mesorhizobium composti]
MAFKHLLHALALLVLGLMPQSAGAGPLQIVGFGDSLMAGYQLAPGDRFTDQLEKALRDKGFDVSVANAGVSGDTTSGGLARLDWSVPDGTALVILEFGGNDMLRGIDPALVDKNLDAMLARLKERDIPVLLAGMVAAPNLGHAYGEAFGTIYPRLAEKYGVPLYPFFLDGVAGNSALQLEDAMHPNAAGVKRIVEGILPMVEKAVSTLQSKS